VTDEPLEKLVARRIREQLDEGGLEGLTRGRIEAQAQEVRVFGIQAAGEVGFPEVKQAAPPGEALAVIESASPELANDVRSRSPQDITLALTLWSAFVQTLEFLVMLFQIVHGQPPTSVQINEIFNHTTNVFNQTTNIVINMPPHN
jgi:hypothetical protein